ncbi:hypothetical protein [Gordonia insulae]|uniref:Uncharacterized protein n=1 Tax=Gordonia insulae TaxID=2420509 RepID=A0A3G8JVN1_9ACTN|nr:hypothetical protein [Gordonia insulae]AZG48652.1 hypothetical protein D7316_05272 [Gordonia insulae]
MNTPFGGARQRGRNREPQLSEFPAWGLEIMMGLYGPDTIEKACDQQKARALAPGEPEGHPTDRPWEDCLDAYDWAAPRPVVDDRDVRGAPPAPPQPVSPIVVELEAINELVRYLERKFKRH